MKQVGIGVIGCGNISDIYLDNINTIFPKMKLVGLADLDEEKAKAQAAKYESKVFSTEELLDHPDVDIILNITTPGSHRKVCEMALMAGKHVYVEKPLSLNTGDGKFLLELAEKKDLLIGGAPDTFLGAGIKTCKKLIEDGWIGDIIGANAFMMCHGHESWHPAPEFYYKPGGGPMFDMGPYYLTALVYLMGSVNQVVGMTKKSFEKRVITSQPLNGSVIDVEVATHLAALLDFENGATGQLTTSFDVWEAETPRIEIYGSKGTLSVPDPNTFGGPVRLKTQGDDGFKEIPLAYAYKDNSRGLGMNQMAEVILSKKEADFEQLEVKEIGEKDSQKPVFEANGKLTYHVLEVMEGIHKSWEEKAFVKIESQY